MSSPNGNQNEGIEPQNSGEGVDEMIHCAQAQYEAAARRIEMLTAQVEMLHSDKNRTSAVICLTGSLCDFLKLGIEVSGHLPAQETGWTVQRPQPGGKPLLQSSHPSSVACIIRSKGSIKTVRGDTSSLRRERVATIYL